MTICTFRRIPDKISGETKEKGLYGLWWPAKSAGTEEISSAFFGGPAREWLVSCLAEGHSNHEIPVMAPTCQFQATSKNGGSLILDTR